MSDRFWMIVGAVTGVGLVLYIVLFMVAMMWITIRFVVGS